MGKQLDLLKDKPRTLYFKYLLPSVSASLVTSIYILADTIMIGRGCGAAALAALNLVLPVFALLFAFGMLFGIGGGVLYSVARGNNDNEHAKNIWSTALSLNILSAILILVFGGLFFEKLCYFLGADENSITMVMDYAKYVVFGAPAYMFSAFLQAFVRNDKQPKRAMIAVITGAITNIILDYIFIFNFKMGLSGGAAATLIGNITTAFILSTHFLSKDNGLHFNFKNIKPNLSFNIISSGAPSFFIEAATGLITLTFNKQILKYLGELGVVAYGVVANYALVLQSLFNGIGQASQPIMATNFGGGLHERVKAIRKMGLITVLAVASIAVICAYVIPVPMTALFVEISDELLKLSIPALNIYFLAFWFLGINLFFTTCLQSIVKSTPALVIMVLRGVILPIVFAIILPEITGSGIAIFAAVPCSEFIVSMLSIAFIKKFGANKN